MFLRALTRGFPRTIYVPHDRSDATSNQVLGGSSVVMKRCSSKNKCIMLQKIPLCIRVSKKFLIPFPLYTSATNFIMSLQNQIVLITGGCKNLGAFAARQFAAQGAILALHYNSGNTEAAADEIAAELNAKTYQADLTHCFQCSHIIRVSNQRSWTP